MKRYASDDCLNELIPDHPEGNGITRADAAARIASHRRARIPMARSSCWPIRTAACGIDNSSVRARRYCENVSSEISPGTVPASGSYQRGAQRRIDDGEHRLASNRSDL